MVPDHFWTLRRRKSVRRCVAKHVSKSKCKKLTVPDHPWKLRCQKSVLCCGAKQIWKNWGFDPFVTLKCRKSAH